MPTIQNIDKALTDHFGSKRAAETVLGLFGDLESKLLTGTGPSNSESLAFLLEEAYLGSRAVGLRPDAQETTVQWAPQPVLPTTQWMVNSALELDFDELLLEWAAILARNKRVFPANVLPPVMSYFAKHPERAKPILSVLGPRAHQVATHLEKWSVFNPDHWTRPLEFRLKSQRLLAFTCYRMKSPEEAIVYFVDHLAKMQDADRRSWCEVLIKTAKSEEWPIFETFERSRYSALQECWAKLAYYQSEPYRKSCEHMLRLGCRADSAWKPVIVRLDGKAFQWPLDRVVESLAPECIEQHLPLEDYFQWVDDHSLNQAFIASFQWNESIGLRKAYFTWLLKNKKLMEGFPTEALMRGLDHKTFNELCMLWLDSHKEQTDLEAFYQANKHFNHFWSDELCERILQFREVTAFQKKYDLTVFWQMLAFKINPNSKLAQQIPAECRCSINRIMHYDSIIRFRKWIRL